MYLFFIKKVFFDAWDNLLSLIVLNIGFVIIVAGFAYTSIITEPGSITFFVLYVLLIFLFNFYTCGVAGYTKDILYSGSGELKSIFKTAVNGWKQWMLLSFITIAEASILFVGFPFYLSVGGVAGLAGAVTIFWVTFFWALASQYYFPAGFQLKGGVGKQIKKSFMLLLDNTGFTIFLGLHTIVVFAVSFFTAFLIPGISVIILSHQIALKLRLYKYDYLEEYPDAKRSAIPWDALLAEEREHIGPRSLKGMIFPWKD